MNVHPLQDQDQDQVLNVASKSLPSVKKFKKENRRIIT